MKAWALCAVVVLAGCGGGYGLHTEPPRRAYDAQLLEPEGWYYSMYMTLRECACSERPYEDIEWLVTGPKAMRHPTADTVYVGMYSAPNRIYLDERYVMHWWVVAHELLHYLSDLEHGESFTDLSKRCMPERFPI